MESTSLTTKCVYCGRVHEDTCPRIAAIEYYPDGTVKRVELATPTLKIEPYTRLDVTSPTTLDGKGKISFQIPNSQFIPLGASRST